MDLNQKNNYIEQYINELALQINNQYKDLIDKDKISRAIEMFKNSNEDLEREIIPRINELAQKVINEYTKRLNEKQQLETIKITDLDYNNTFFHFTYKSNISNIVNSGGFKPKIGIHSSGIEKTPKVFFSKGYEGVLKLADVWLKWVMNRLFSSDHNLANKYFGINTDTSTWQEEFLSDRYKFDAEKKRILFEYMISGLKQHNYLALDLEENVDFKYDDLDENKESQQKGTINDQYSRKFYGNYSNCDNNIMDDWNMHTLSNKKIDLKNTKLILSSNGNSDCLSILKEIYIIYNETKKQNIQFDLLDDFIIYAQQKEIKSSLHAKTNQQKGNSAQDFELQNKNNKAKVLKKTQQSTGFINTILVIITIFTIAITGVIMLFVLN